MAGTVTEPVWVGVDLGTQSIRVLAVDDTGHTVAGARRALHGTRHGERHEQDPLSWWESAASALTEVTSSLRGRPVGAVAICATSGTVLLAGPDGEPRTPALMYDDSRAGGLASVAQEAGAELWGRLGYRMQPAWALPKLLWWRESDFLETGSRLVHQPDFVAARLVGHPVATDASHALKTGYDLIEDRWPTDVLDRLGLDPAVLPPVVRPGTTLGLVDASGAARTGLAPGTPVVAGMTDGCAAQLAAGALAVGSWNSVLGTTLALKGVSAELPHDPTGAVYSHRAPHDDLWLPGGASSTGAGAIRVLFPDFDLAELTTAAADVRDVPLCYPLVGRGERFPFVAPEAYGFLGDGPLAVSDDPARVFAAVCTGIAHVERLSFELLARDGASAVAFTGGAARNEWWNQLRCDVLGAPVRLPENPEPALGMAVLAAGALSGDIPAAAAALVRIRRVLEPDLGRHAALTPAYHDFVAALVERGWWKE